MLMLLITIKKEEKNIQNGGSLIKLLTALFRFNFYFIIFHSNFLSTL